MVFVLLLMITLLLMFAPAAWVKYTMNKYAMPLDKIDGTGAELAEHLVEKYDLAGVKVVKCAPGMDHYNPETKEIALSPEYHNVKSLTSVAVGAHEFAHALQHHNNEKSFYQRQRWVVNSQRFYQLGRYFMWAMPIIAFITKSPTAVFVMVGFGLIGFVIEFFTHLLTLYVEWDASFAKAYPLLKADFIDEGDQFAVYDILKAAALTYVASVLMSVFDVRRWFIGPRLPR